jgi:hypothetical protein
LKGERRTVPGETPDDQSDEGLQSAVGHYGVFNGSRFRSEIAPRIADFVLSMGHAARARGGFSGRVVQNPRSLHNGGGAGPRAANVVGFGPSRTP